MFNVSVLSDFADGVFWLRFYNREGCIQSSGVDFTQDLPRLIILLFALQRFELKHWGFHPELDALACQIHHGFAETAGTQLDLSPEVQERLHQSVRERDATTGGQSTLSIDPFFTLDDGKSVMVNLNNHQPIHQRHGLCGCATQVCAISEVHTLNPSVDSRRFVLKAYWPDIARLPEDDVIQSAFNVCSMKPDMVNDLPYVFGSRGDTASATHLIRTALAVEPMPRRHRVMRRIVFEELYRLQDQATSEVGMRMILEVSQCHYTLWKAGIHHTDISLDNIMVQRHWTTGNDAPRLFGVLNDWDLASTPNLAHALLRPTGTVPYMHPELLTQEYWEGQVPRLYLHANASFIWVMAFLFLRYNKGKIIDSPTLPLDDLITNDFDLARMVKKDIIYQIPTFTCGPDAEKEWKVVVDLLVWTSNPNETTPGCAPAMTLPSLRPCATPTMCRVPTRNSGKF
ncbi:hypothetical protein B0H17DRAFT_45430 [Mycena rosella]|uniref:Fungal-type protein kinase domain-containing protein n=1 Tax=Mycena rosella TaxID=1033263 RepID=A0AAD7GA11_MYCRO|nr:hypothetical protein B0H17DRAFT_45430 [Mycena rosella]